MSKWLKKLMWVFAPGFRPNTVNGYIDTGYVYDISKTTKIEIKCKFDDTTTYSTVCGNHFIPNFSFGHNENGQWWAVLFSDSVTSSVTMLANTWYTVEITLANGTQTVKVNGTQIFSETHTSSSDNTHSIYLYTRNSSGTKEASTTIWIQYCKIWENGVLKRDMTPHIPHDYSYNKWSFFDNVEKKFYDISGNLSYNYPLARRIRKIYAGINNVVKKVKKAYIGVNGIAKLFYQAVEFINFTTRQSPTTWEYQSSQRYNGTNSYGTWQCYSSVTPYSSSTAVYEAFDGTGDVGNGFAANNDATEWNVDLYCPTKIAINPRTIRINKSNMRNGIVYGRLTGTSTWVELGNFSDNTRTTVTFTISGTDYYDAFRMYHRMHNIDHSLREFTIQEGIIRKEY